MTTATNQAPPDRVYTVRYVSRHWVGKPDPSGFGQCEITYRDPSAAHEAALSLKFTGDAKPAFVKGLTELLSRHSKGEK